VVKAFAFVSHPAECGACHTVKKEHLESGEKSAVTRTPKSETCGSCHAAQRAAFNRTFAHRQGREPMACIECHDVHGNKRAERISATRTSAVCVECHADLAGPRVFEHRAVQVNGCTACHDSHGSANARLLKRRDVASLCLECHTNAPQFHDITQTKFRACVTCHVAVHGSNRDANLLEE
jgi:DmsE family decaheme c-type cytochrome